MSGDPHCRRQVGAVMASTLSKVYKLVFFWCERGSIAFHPCYTSVMGLRQVLAVLGSRAAPGDQVFVIYKAKCQRVTLGTLELLEQFQYEE